MRPVGNMKPGCRTVNLVQSFSESGMTAVVNGKHEAEILGYLCESHDDKGVRQSFTTMTTTSGDHEDIFPYKLV